MGVFGADRRDHHAAVHGPDARAGTTVRVELVRGLRGSVSGEDRYSQSAARSARGREEGRGAGWAGQTGTTRFSDLGLGNAPPADLRDGGNGGGLACTRLDKRVHQDRTAAAEFRSTARMA